MSNLYRRTTGLVPSTTYLDPESFENLTSAILALAWKGDVNSARKIAREATRSA